MRGERLDAAAKALVSPIPIPAKAWVFPIPPGAGVGGSGEILVWWAGKEQNGDMLLLAHLLTVDDDWRRARITLVSVVPDDAAAVERKSQVEAGLADTRIQAAVEAIVKPPGQSVTDLIHQRSRDCDLVFLGLPLVQAGDEAVAAERLLRLVDGLPSTVLVRSAGPFRGRLV